MLHTLMPGVMPSVLHKRGLTALVVFIFYAQTSYGVSDKMNEASVSEFSGEEVAGKEETGLSEGPSESSQQGTSKPPKQCGIPGVGDLEQFQLMKDKPTTATPLLKIVQESPLDSVAGSSNTTGTAEDSQEDPPSPKILRFPGMVVKNVRKTGLISSRRIDPLNEFGGSSLGFVQPTIVGGFEAIPNQICWQAKLTINLGGGAATCGGTIIGPRTIVTAAHCTLDPFNDDIKVPIELKRFSVQIGAMNRAFNALNIQADHTGCAQNFNVSRLIVHPNYSQEVGDNDLAILILSEEIDIENKPCACALCIRDKAPAVDEMCMVSGMGDESQGGTRNHHPVPLKWVRVRILKQSTDGTCTVSTTSEGLSTDLDKFLCAGDMVGEDSCLGDSGGPMFCFDRAAMSYYLAGVVSFGEGCGTGVGGQYTKIRLYVQWILDNSNLL